MPFEWENKIVVTKDELVPNWYSWDSLRTAIDRYKNKSIGIKRARLGGKNHVMLIDFDSLPIEVQNGLGDPRKVEHVLEQYYRTDNEAVVFFTKYRMPNGDGLKHQHQNQYIVNASVLNALISFRAVLEKQRKKKKNNATGITGELCEYARTFQKTLKVRSNDEHSLPESEKRFKETLKAFEKDGYVSLISGKHGNDNSRKVDDSTMGLLESMFAKDTTKPTATDVHRKYTDFMAGRLEIINNESGEIYAPADFKPLSPTTVSRYLSDWQSQIATHAIRGGDRQRNIQNFKTYHSLDKPKFAGSIISVDDRQPPFKMHNGKRMWFYNGIDLGSEVFTVSVHGDSKEGIITEFYRAMVRNYAHWGVCLPYELEAEMSLNASFTDTFLREGAMFQEVRIEANNARGKKIERYFGALRYQYEKKREGWLARPFALSESNQAGSHEVPTLSRQEIIDNCQDDIEMWNSAPHSVHTHMSRWEVFLTKQHPDLKPINYDAILPYLGYSTPSSCKVGIIQLQGGEYLLGEDSEVCTGEKLIALMKHVEGRKVTLYWMDDVEGNVLKALVYMGDQRICEAVSKPTYNRAKIEQTEQDVINREIMSKYEATIRGYGKSRKSGIEDITQIDHTPAPARVFKTPGRERKVQFTNTDLPELPQLDTEGNLPEAPQISFVKTLDNNF